MIKEFEFLKEYEKLCRKYDMALYGCGCCGSPFLGIGLEKESILTWKKCDEKDIDFNNVVFSESYWYTSDYFDGFLMIDGKVEDKRKSK